MNSENLQTAKKMVVLGAGESGVGAALLAQAKGWDVLVSDIGEIADNYRKELKKNSIDFEEGRHSIERILDAHCIVKSPGIPEKVEVVQAALNKGIEVISEIEFAARYSNAKFIAITGSNGKTTTTLMTYHLIKKAGYKVGLAGNIGDSLARQLVNEDKEYFVLELSSFQLDGMYDFKAHVAILLNITPDHLDRYDNNFNKYIDSKFRITQNMTFDDYFIAFGDDEVIKNALMEKEVNAFKLNVSLEDRVLNGAYMKAHNLMININNHITSVFSIDSNILPVAGKHNMINTMAAIMAALAVGVKEEAIKKSIGTFKNAPHRLEEAGFIKGVRYVNDSKATNVDAVKFALDSFDQPVIWIAGGVDKGNDYKQIDELVYEKVKTLICIGEDNKKLGAAFSEHLPMILEATDMNEAVRLSNELAQYGDLVLLSPACASFDRFRNYEDRGDQFKSAVKSLERSQKKLNLLLNLAW